MRISKTCGISAAKRKPSSKHSHSRSTFRILRTEASALEKGRKVGGNRSDCQGMRFSPFSFLLSPFAPLFQLFAFSPPFPNSTQRNSLLLPERICSLELGAALANFCQIAHSLSSGCHAPLPYPGPTTTPLFSPFFAQPLPSDLAMFRVSQQKRSEEHRTIAC